MKEKMERKRKEENEIPILSRLYRERKKNEADLEAMAKVEISRPPGPGARGLT